MSQKSSVFLQVIMFIGTVCNYVSSSPSVYVLGFSILNEDARKVTFYDVNGFLYAPEGDEIKLRLFGKFNANTYLKLSLNLSCTGSGRKKLRVVDGNDQMTAEAEFTLPSVTQDHTPVYLCLQDGASSTAELQGKYLGPNGKSSVRPWLTIKLKQPLKIPMWLHIIFIIILLALSALFSGLNLGLLSLDKTDLKVIINTGSQKERSEALKIAPVRNHGNFLLCSLLFSNVLVNTMLTLLMDQVIVGGGWQTVAVTTLAIVIIGEILPQAVCSRFGLTVGAKTIWITKFFMTISFPVSYPVGKLLDKLLGEEIGAVYTRDRLKELLKVTRDQHGLESEEMGIISGTLDMKTKTVKEVMTPLDNMFMVSYDDILNVDLLVNIEDSGFTRIPVYQGERWNVIGVLNVKNLTLYDPAQNIPVKKQIEQSKTHLFWVFENTRLDYMLKAFREGSRGHIAFVQRINDEGPEDPKYETIGLVTLEDVLEELLQAEIYDENDVERLQSRTEERNLTAPR